MALIGLPVSATMRFTDDDHDGAHAILALLTQTSRGRNVQVPIAAKRREIHIWLLLYNNRKSYGEYNYSIRFDIE